jgi:transcriptional regulator with XRE-family HTH domain
MPVPAAKKNLPSTAELIQLGQELEAARTTAGLSAREVAEMAGISAGYLRAIERGSNPKTGRPSRPGSESVLAIARALGLEASEILGRYGYPSTSSTGLAGRRAQVPARRAVNSLLGQLHGAVKGLNHRSPFMYTCTVDRLEEFAADFRLMAEGTLRTTPEEEPHLTRMAVDQCHSHLRAVSYQDGSWWAGPAGDSYLQLHGELLANREVEMTRIFIIKPDALDSLRTTLDRHVELKINTYVLYDEEVNDYYWRDFVLYDEVLLRLATAVDPTASRKTAEFTDDPNRIMQALEDFKYLYRVATANIASTQRVVAKARDL